MIQIAKLSWLAISSCIANQLTNCYVEYCFNVFTLIGFYEKFYYVITSIHWRSILHFLSIL